MTILRLPRLNPRFIVAPRASSQSTSLSTSGVSISMCIRFLSLFGIVDVDGAAIRRGTL
jgi:hypothetical protein